MLSDYVINGVSCEEERLYTFIMIDHFSGQISPESIDKKLQRSSSLVWTPRELLEMIIDRSNLKSDLSIMC